MERASESAREKVKVLNLKAPALMSNKLLTYFLGIAVDSPLSRNA